MAAHDELDRPHPLTDRLMTLHDAVYQRDRVCLRKHPYRSRRAATGDSTVARTGTRPYRCPFSRWHWHVGHPPSLRQLARTAAAIRVLRQNGVNW